MTTLATDTPPRPAPARAWMIAGLVLLAYAVLGNYLVLPGYRRFIESGGTGASGPALIWGAARTILWMISFQLGALCLSLGVLITYGDSARRFRRWFCIGAATWLGFWSIPKLPSPAPAFFAGVGVVILAAIIALFWVLAARRTSHGEEAASNVGAPWRVASLFFFAAATWEMCGLGSVGGILSPQSSLHAANTALVATQATKLILELALAWLLALAAVAAPSFLPSSGRR